MAGGLAGVRAEIAGVRGDTRTDFASVREEIAVLRISTNRDFRWLVGIQMTVMLTVIGVLVTALYR
jgi:hypothetical protein